MTERPTNRIAELRRQRKWRQHDLSEVSGVTQEYISKIETGSANPTLDHIAAIAAGLNVRIGELFDAPEHTPQAQAAAEALDRLPPDRRALALDLLDSLGSIPAPEMPRFLAVLGALLDTTAPGRSNSAP